MWRKVTCTSISLSILNLSPVLMIVVVLVDMLAWWKKMPRRLWERMNDFHKKEVLIMALRPIKKMFCKLQAVLKIVKDNKNKLFWTTYLQGKSNHSCWHHSDKQHHSSRELNHSHSFLFHSTGLKILQMKWHKLWFSLSLCMLLQAWNLYFKWCSLTKTQRSYDPYSPWKENFKSEFLYFIYKELNFTHFLFNISNTSLSMME